MAKVITVPAVRWALGDVEQWTQSHVTVSTRPLYYRPNSATDAIRVGSINPDYAGVLIAALSCATKRKDSP